MLGASGSGDIGEHFPDSDSKYHNIQSIKLLTASNDIIEKKGWYVSNVDCVIIADEPRLQYFKDEMRQVISGALKIDKQDVGIKVTSQEGMGLIGRGEAIASYAVVLLKRKGEGGK